MMAKMLSRMGPSSGRSTSRLVTSWWFTYVSRGDHTCKVQDSSLAVDLEGEIK